MKGENNPSPVRYRIDISEPAENDLREIVRYIFAQLSAPTTTMEMLEAMEQAMSSLGEMPIGPLLSQMNVLRQLAIAS